MRKVALLWTPMAQPRMGNHIDEKHAAVSLLRRLLVGGQPYGCLSERVCAPSREEHCCSLQLAGVTWGTGTGRYDRV